LNIVFDLGGVVVRWEPETLIAEVFDDPEVCKVVHSEFVGHPDWVELDRGTLTPADAVVRASERTGLSCSELSHFLQRVPSRLIPITDTVENVRARRRGHGFYRRCGGKSNYRAADWHSNNSV
jgi:putative hydrolase of the HAD superfamily